MSSKYRKPLPGIDEKQATIIELGREAVAKHKVSSETFARALKLFGERNLVNCLPHGRLRLYSRSARHLRSAREAER